MQSPFELHLSVARAHAFKQRQVIVHVRCNASEQSTTKSTESLC